MKTVFKVLKRIDGKLQSCTMGVNNGGIIYKKTKLNHPKIKRSLLLCFSTFNDAKWFVEKNGLSNIEIWESKAGKEKPLPKFRLYTYFSIDRVKSLWDGTDEGMTRWPPGTIGVTSVKLVKK